MTCRVIRNPRVGETVELKFESGYDTCRVYVCTEHTCGADRVGWKGREGEGGVTASHSSFFFLSSKKKKKTRPSGNPTVIIESHSGVVPRLRTWSSDWELGLLRAQRSVQRSRALCSWSAPHLKRLSTSCQVRPPRHWKTPLEGGGRAMSCMTRKVGGGGGRKVRRGSVGVCVGV